MRAPRIDRVAVVAIMTVLLLVAVLLLALVCALFLYLRTAFYLTDCLARALLLTTNRRRAQQAAPACAALDFGAPAYQPLPGRPERWSLESNCGQGSPFLGKTLRDNMAYPRRR
jgi:hypothetical protein